MNEILRLSLLGTPPILVGERSLTGLATYKKAQALLFYLAVTAYSDAAQAAPHSRDALATLLWDELSDAQAKQNLRNVLPDLRRLVGDYVQINRQTVAFDHTHPYWLDVEVLRRSLEPSPSAVDLTVRQAAVDLYQDEFLHGFYVRDAPAFETWVVEQREQIHTLVVNALTGLVSEYVLNDNAEAALVTNRRLLVLDPWSEPTHRQHMRLLAQTGERVAALAQYETCRRVLATEFGIEPLPETTALYEQIRAGEIGSGGEQEQGSGETSQSSFVITHLSLVASKDQQNDANHSTNVEGQMTSDKPLLQAVNHNLPRQTRFYGWRTELASLQKWVFEDGCHLVGIFGIGGQGKTTLAATLVHGLAAAAALQTPGGHFQHIIWQSLLNAPPLVEVMQEWVYVLSDQMVTTLPASLDQQFNQLLAYLRRQHCLLILDNVESISNTCSVIVEGAVDPRQRGEHPARRRAQRLLPTGL